MHVQIANSLNYRLFNVLDDFNREGLTIKRRGQPSKNTNTEHYNTTVRYKWLNHYFFYDIENVQNRAPLQLWICNNQHPNMV
jgi:putative transposase